MKPIELVAWDDERIYIPFTVPRKGAKALTVKLPRFDFMSEDVADAIAADIDALDAQDPPPSALKKVKQIGLAMVKHVVTDQQLKAFEALAPGNFQILLDQWQKHSSVSLGESLASVSSSMSTGAQSTPTSKPESDAPGGTSDVGSGGETSETS